MKNKEIIKKAFEDDFNKKRNYDGIMKKVRGERMKNIFKYSLVSLCLILVLVGGYFGYRIYTDKNDNEEKSPKETIVIANKEWFNYYDMGVSMEKKPTSPVYAYAIKKDKDSYKVVSLHENGVNYEMIAVSINEKSVDNADLSTHYKVVAYDGKVYFIHTAYLSSEDTLTSRKDAYDIEIYYINLEGETPILEVVLQKVSDTYLGRYTSPFDYVGNLYYLDQEKNTIEVISLVDDEVIKPININKEINYFSIMSHISIVEDGKVVRLENDIVFAYGPGDNGEAKYYKIYMNKYNDNLNEYTVISEEEYQENVSLKRDMTFRYSLYYFDFNRYLELYTNGKRVYFNGNNLISNEKDEKPTGDSITYDGEVIYNKVDENKDLYLLNADENRIRFCLGTNFKCEEYFEYDIETKELLENTDPTFIYFVVNYLEKS